MAEEEKGQGTVPMAEWAAATTAPGANFKHSNRWLFFMLVPRYTYKT